MAIDYGEVSKAIVAKLVATSAVTNIVGTRIYNFVPRSVSTFPWVRFNQVASPPYTGIMGPTWIWDYTVDFVIFDNSTSQARVCDAIKAISTVMEAGDLGTVTGALVMGIWPRQQGPYWDDEAKAWAGLASFQIALEEN